MALQAVTPDAVLVIPGPYGTFKVQTNPQGVSTSGILVLMGEADQGPDYASEDSLAATFYGPDETARVMTKYGSGPLVDAMRIASQAANDPDIQGAPQGFFLIKTNAPDKASLLLERSGLSDYGTLFDLNFGDPGNMISTLITNSPAEIAPHLEFAYLPIPDLSSDDSAVSLRINGGAVETLSNIPKQSRPSAFVGSVASGSSTGLNSLADILATGGEARDPLDGFANSNTLAVTASGNDIAITLGGAIAWGTTPEVGDVLIIPNAATYGSGKKSAIAGASNENLGTYIVTAATATSISATKMRDATALTVSAPASVSAAALVSAAVSSGQMSRTSNTVTVNTTAAHNFASGDRVYIQTTDSTNFPNGFKTIAVTDADTFTYSETGGDATSAATATAAQQYDILVFSPVVLKNMSGTTRQMLITGNVTATVTGVASGSQLVLTLNTGEWNAIPEVDDTIYIPSSAPSAWHATDTNGGYYVVTAATATTVTMTRLSVGDPTSFSATAIAATTDLICKRPQIDGVGKALEIYDGGDDVNIDESFVTLAGEDVDWLSSSGTPILNVSDQELEVQITAARQNQNLSEELVAGGEVVMLVGYKGTTATLTLTNTLLTTSVAGGTGANLSLKLKNFKTVGDLAVYISSQTGYTASPATNAMAQVKLFDGTKLVLDKSTYNIATTHGNQAGRIKRDAWDFYRTLKTQSLLIQLGNPAAPVDAGLPDAKLLTFLAGGTRGATTNASILTALTACEKLRANFVIPLFSRDATEDIDDGLTDEDSTYTIASINANVKSHVLKMSQYKAQRHRQGFVSIQDTFANAQEMASAMASFRVALTFQASLATDSTGTIQTMQPWALGVFAAAMQAAGFYRSIMAKGINTSGILSTDASFDADSDTQVEQALLTGMLVARGREGGGFAWVSDQTTYAVDSNFVYNSIQAVYDADLVTLTTSKRMGRAFVGQSLADVSAASAAGVFAAIMADLKRLKLLAKSDDAPEGYKNAKFKIQGNVLFCEAEIKIANAIAFVPISFTVSEVQQTASI